MANRHRKQQRHRGLPGWSPWHRLLQLGWTALLVTAACGTGPVHDLILPWHQPLSALDSLLFTTPDLEGLALDQAWDAVFSGVPAFVQLWALGCVAGNMAVSQMELNRFEPTKYLWLGASTLALSWPVAVYCSCAASQEWSARMNQAAALTVIEVLAVVGAHLFTARHVDYERRGVDPTVSAELSKWDKDCATSMRYSICAVFASLVFRSGLFGELGKPLGIVIHDVAIASYSIAFGAFLWNILVRQALTRSSMGFEEGDEGWPLRSLKDDYASSTTEIYFCIIVIWLWLI